MNVTVIGAGLAGSEAAWQLAQRGFHVILREMKLFYGNVGMPPKGSGHIFRESVAVHRQRASGLDPGGVRKRTRRGCPLEDGRPL